MVQPVERFEVEPPIERGRNWPALVASAVFHLVILLLLLYGIPAAAPVRPLPTGSRTPEPIVFAMPQPRQAPRTQPPRPRQPPPQTPPLKEQILGPDAKKPAEVPKQAARTAAPDQTPASPPQQQQPPQPQQQPAAPPATAPQQAPTTSTSPLRIPQPGDYLGGRGIVAPTPSPFPPPSIASSSAAPQRATALGMGRLGVANTSREQFENSFDDETQGKCVDVPNLGKNPDGTPVLAAVTGTVYEEDGVTPLPNAHLQIIGYPYSTFSDANGKYRLEFDPATLAHCRAQYVVVEAVGHRSQTLTLAIGPNIVSPPIIMKRR